jgi:flagellar hook-associated protein 3 FlgL
MTFTTIGDQSQLFLTRRQTAMLRGDLTRLSQELASGRLTSPATRTTGDTAHVLSIQRGLTALAAYRTANAEAAQFTAVAQTALGGIQGIVTALGPALVAAAPLANATNLGISAADARGKFASAVGALNTQSGGRSVLAGTAVDVVPLADADAMLAALRTAIGGQTDASGIASVVDDWFNAPGGGFESLAWRGSGQATSFRVAPAEDASVGVTAADPGIRAILKGLAMASLVDAPELSGNVAEQAKLSSDAGLVLIGADTGLTAMRAGLGATERRIETLATRQSAEKTALDMAEARFTVADPYETATALQEVSTQLETLYTVTARLSRLSLTEYLR